MKLSSYKDIKLFYHQLTKQGIHHAKIKSERMIFICGNDALKLYRKEFGTKIRKLFSDIKSFDFTQSEDSNKVLSIGSTQVHDQAKCYSLNINCPYATCPVPLSNDSFATNRAQGSLDAPAVKTMFPQEVILDWDICRRFGANLNLLGLGEVFGLVTSVRDYQQCHSSNSDKELVNIVDEIVEDLIGSWSNQKVTENCVIKLGAALSIKGLLIRMTSDNSIVAGCDHIISYELAHRGLKWPHGRLVLAGVLLSLPFTHADPIFIICKLLDFAFSSNLFSSNHIHDLLKQDIAGVLKNCVARRPNRKTILRITTQDSIRSAERQIRKVFYGYI